MNFWDDQKNVESYISMCSDYDGSFVHQFVLDTIPRHSAVLEIGMGPGTDMDALSKTYSITGSDRSQIFLNLYRKAHPDADLLNLDAVSLDTQRRFDAVFSNKVLQHLTDREFQDSLAAQSRILRDGGLAVHTLWYGGESEEMMGMLFNYHSEESLTRLVGNTFEIQKMERYREAEDGDSIVLVLKK